MCFFANRSVTLPCPYLFDASSPLLQGVEKWTSNCERLLKGHLLEQCLSEPPTSCLPAGGDAATARMCHASVQHMRGDCAWGTVAGRVRAIHFKGKNKPWPFASRHANSVCRPAMFGPLTVLRPTASREKHGPVDVKRAGAGGETVRLPWWDDIEWDETASERRSERRGERAGGIARGRRLSSSRLSNSSGACVTVVGRSPVFWAGATPKAQRGGLPRRCCRSLTQLQAEWGHLLVSHSLTNARDPAWGDRDRQCDAYGVPSHCGANWTLVGSTDPPGVAGVAASRKAARSGSEPPRKRRGGKQQQAKPAAGRESRRSRGRSASKSAEPTVTPLESPSALIAKLSSMGGDWRDWKAVGEVLPGWAIDLERSMNDTRAVVAELITAAASLARLRARPVVSQPTGRAAA